MSYQKSKTLTKADIYTDLYNKIGYSQKYSADLVNSVFDVISDKLCNNHHVRLSGFGNFLLRDKQPRIGRDPKTGHQITIKARKVVVFHSSPILKEKVKKRRG